MSAVERHRSVNAGQAPAGPQELLDSCIDALSSHIAVLDENGVILAVNAAWRRFADDNGFTGVDYGIGSSYFDACQPASTESVDCLSVATGLRDVMHGRKDRFELEYPCHSARGNQWFVLRVTRVTEPGPARLVVAHENVTERREAEEALRDAGRRKDEFLALLAHELRNPLAPIRHVLQIMRMSGGHGQLLHSAFEIMERQIGHMVRMVDDLLDVSRISRGRIELRVEDIDLVSVIQQAVEVATPHIANMTHKLSVTLPSAAILTRGDSTRLAQAVSNLLNNASKFTDSGGSIHLSLERDGQEAVIRVRDSGIGIAAEQLPLVFDMFTQLDSSLERTQSGLGIGLTVVKNLVELHDGNVQVYSAGVGQGCEFTVRLPIREGVEEPGHMTLGDPQTSSPRRILVVDDNEDSANSLAVFLQLLGNETHTAFDGIEALEKAASLHPDVVLLDIGMPRMNGYEVAAKLRAQPWGEQVILVAVTGWGQNEDRHRAHDAGFDCHMVKPIDPESLTTTLAGLSAQRANRDGANAMQDTAGLANDSVDTACG
ncbi:MAG TPA: ATP-binding protein [Burkholderiaceae bacterium]|nr:ATP-binding protein [Burkholderiaceae bacterium]